MNLQLLCKLEKIADHMWSRSHGNTYVCLILGLSLAIGNAQAAEFNWNNPVGGVLTDPANWAGGVAPPPGLDNTSVFNLGSAGASVTLTGDYFEGGRLIIGNDNVNFNLGGFIYNLNANPGPVQTFTDANPVVVGRLPGDNASLSISNGFFTHRTLLPGGSFPAAPGNTPSAFFAVGLAGSTGSVAVTGANTTLDTIMLIGSNASTTPAGIAQGTGAVTVNNGATLNGTVSVQSNSSFIVDGVGTTFTGANRGTAFRNGLTNFGSSSIINGASFTAESLLSQGNGHVLIDGAGTTVTITDFMNVGGVGTGFGNTSTLLDPALVTISGGALLDTSQTAGNVGNGFTGTDRIGINGGFGKVVVDGVGSTWNSSGVIAGSAGTGVINVINGGTWNSTGTSSIAFENPGAVVIDGVGSTWNSTSNSTSLGRIIISGGSVSGGEDGSLTVSNGGAVNAVDFDVSISADRAKRVVTVDVGGIGSSVHASNRISMGGIGSTSISDNITVTVHDGASLSSDRLLQLSKGTMDINTGGTVVVGSATAVANGVAVGAGGQLLVGGRASIDVNKGVPIAVGVPTLNASLVDIQSGGVLRGSGMLTSSVQIRGGTMSAGGLENEISSFINPAIQVGNLNVVGDYSQDASSIFDVDIDFANVLAGDVALVSDVLNVSGTATLDGLLDISLVTTGFGSGPFFTPVPVLGDTFDILTADTILGQFSGLNTLSPLAAGLAWDVSYILDPALTDIVRLSVVEAPAAVPVPPAVWLFGSGLLGLVGVARRRTDRG